MCWCCRRRSARVISGRPRRSSWRCGRSRRRRARAEHRHPDADQRRVPQGVRRGLPRPGQQGAARAGLLLRPDRPPAPAGLQARQAPAGRREAEPHAVHPSCSRTSRGTSSSTRTSCPAEIIASLRRKEELDLPQVTVTTDFETHRLWVNQPCDRYSTATEEGAAYLQPLGRAARARPRHRHPDPPRLRAPEGPGRMPGERRAWSATGPIVLQLAGGFGVGPIEKLFRGVLEVRDAAGGGRRRRQEREGPKSSCAGGGAAAAPGEGDRLHRRRSTS